MMFPPSGDCSEGPAFRHEPGDRCLPLSRAIVICGQRGGLSLHLSPALISWQSRSAIKTPPSLNSHPIRPVETSPFTPVGGEVPPYQGSSQ